MIVYAKVECCGDTHELRRSCDAQDLWRSDCGPSLDDHVYLATLAGAPLTGCQGAVRATKSFVGYSFDGTGVLESAGGARFWYLDGHLHREDAPAVEWSDGGWAWYQRGELHRIGAPAEVHADGTEMWCWRGTLHRLDGPAVTGQRNEWWVHGQRVTKAEHAMIKESEEFMVRFPEFDT